MGYLRIKGSECSYKEKDRRLKEQFINGINVDNMITERKEATKTDNDKFDALIKQEQKNSARVTEETHNNCKYHGSTQHEPRSCPIYGKRCLRCGSVNHMEWVYRSQSRQVSSDGRRERCRAVHNMYHDYK